MRNTIYALSMLFCSGLAHAAEPPVPIAPPLPSFSFSVLADPRSRGDTWKNALGEIRDRTVNPDPAFSPSSFILVAGDIDPLVDRHQDYLSVFTNSATAPLLLPVIGNHEFENGGVHFTYARDVLIPAIPGARQHHPGSCDFHLDHENVRIIAVDAYTDFGKTGVVNAEGLAWVEQLIREAPKQIEHVFVSVHEPAFPRFRHIGDSFDSDPQQRNAFWNMLVRHNDKVRAVLVGHTHHYYRMRVKDPAGEDANNMDLFPDEEGGVYQIDAGAAGNGNTNTLVQIQIEGPRVLFRVLQAEAGAQKPFRVVDEWTLND